MLGCQLFQSGARISNGEKLRAALVARSLVNTFPKVGKERHDFDRSAGFAGEDEEAPSRVDRPRDLVNPARDGGIEDPEARESIELPK